MGTGKSFTAQEIIRALQKQEKFEELNGKSQISQATMIKSDHAADRIELAKSSDVNKQVDNAMGHKLGIGWSNVIDSALKPSKHISDVYDEYLRVYQIGADKAVQGIVIKSKISKRPVTELTFEDWVLECRKQATWFVDTELLRLRKKGKMKKDAFNLSMEMYRKMIEAYNVYLKASETQRIGLV